MQKVMHQNQDRTDDVTMPGRKLMIFQVVAAAQFCGVILKFFSYALLTFARELGEYISEFCGSY